MFSYSRYFSTALKTTLSMMLNTGLKTHFVRYVMFSFNVAIVKLSVKCFTGVANILFYDQWYNTNIAMFPSIDLFGNSPM